MHRVLGYGKLRFMTEEKLVTIGEAAEILGISIDTLRRWDKSGKLKPASVSEAGYRLYSKSQIELFSNDLFALAKTWALDGGDIPGKFYCRTSADFQSRLGMLQEQMSHAPELADIFSLVTAVAGEIGNNSFDHNLGNWPDIPGIFFGYDIQKKTVVLADRGQGILATLKRVKADLHSHEDALYVAFTEVLSGRAPESRGNGLKFVRKIVAEHPIGLVFQTGDAELCIVQESDELAVHRAPDTIQGCFTSVTF